MSQQHEEEPLMADSAPSPVGAAFGWAARIMAVGLTMVLPGIGGRWLDSRLGTGFCEPAGFVLGFTAGLTTLVHLAGTSRLPKRLGKGSE
jgi:hypothetical protein